MGGWLEHGTQRRGAMLVAVTLGLVACGRSDLDGDPRSVWLGEDSNPTAGRGGTSFAGTANSGSTGGGTGGGGTRGGEAGAAGAAAAGAAGNVGALVPDFDFESEPDQAVTYMIDAAHSGAQLATEIRPPLTRLWTRSFEGGISYPVAVGSLIFISANDSGAANPVVIALHADTGETIWQSEPIHSDFIDSAVSLAYDRGRLFATNEDGHVVAFEPESGAVAWRKNVDIYGFGTIPVAAGGALFVIGANVDNRDLFVLDQRDGHLVYQAGAQGAGHPTLGEGALFTSSACFETEAADARNGTVLWHYQEDCFGGGGERTIFHAGFVYVHEAFESTAVLDAKLAQRVASINAPTGAWPMSASNGSIFHAGAELTVFDAATGAERWSAPLALPAALPALITPGFAYVLEGGQLFEDAFLEAIDLTTRQSAWRLEDPAVPDDRFIGTGNEPFQSLAAAAGRIIVPNKRTLAVFVGTPSAP